jgi:hypothetical protein
VLADRTVVIRPTVQQEYPVNRTALLTCSGADYAKGQQADDIGSRRQVTATDPRRWAAAAS